MRRRGDARIADLAVEVADALREPGIAGRARADAEGHGRDRRRKRDAEALVVAAGLRRAGQQVRADRLVGGIETQRRIAGGRVEGGDDAIPRARLDLRVAREADAAALAVAEHQRHAAVLEHHRVAGARLASQAPRKYCSGFYGVVDWNVNSIVQAISADSTPWSPATVT